jgi:hypothetical protein
MELLGSSGGPFDGLTSFIGRSFSRRAKRPEWRPPPPVFADLAPARVIAEYAMTHRQMALELTGEAIEHYLELSRKLAEARRQHALLGRTLDDTGPHRRSQIAEDERLAWERWTAVIESALRGAETEVVAVVRAWEASRRPSEETGTVERGVIHKGRLYLAVPSGEDETERLSIVDLRASLNLDGSMALIDVVTPERLVGPSGPFPFG